MMRRFTVRARLISLGLFSVAIAALLTVIGASQLSALRESQATVAHMTQVRFVAQTAQFDFADFNGWQTAYAFDVARIGPSAAADAADSRKVFLSSAARTRRHLEELQGLVSASATTGVQEAGDHVEAAMRGFREFMKVDAEVVDLYRRGDVASMRAGDALVLGREIELFTDASGNLEKAANMIAAAEREGTVSAGRRAEVARVTLISIALTGIASLVMGAGLIVRSILAPLHALTARLREIAHGGGDLTTRLDVAGRDEFADISGLFNTFVASIADIVRDVSGAANLVRGSASDLNGVALELDNGAQDTTTQVGQLGTTALTVSGATNAVSAATEEMTAAIAEISRQAASASRVAAEAVATVSDTSSAVSDLAEAGKEIDEIVKLITGIAEQTNLLALNATIEAARAGDAGRGFAVVATEVKGLANETARATAEITNKVAAIQETTSRTLETIDRISTIIMSIHEKQTTIAAAVEEQSAVTREIGRSVTDIADSAGVLAGSLASVTATAHQTAAGASTARGAATQLSASTDQILGRLGAFTT